MFSKTAQYYDKIYSFKDYEAETQSLLALLRENTRIEGGLLLDIACGTGCHIEYLKKHFEVEGLDISEDLLEMARQRNPEVVFHQGDMTDFHLGRQFDVVTCLFSSIGYVKTTDRLTRAIGCMASHLKPGGVLAIEPWFTPDAWKPGTVHALMVDEAELKIARVNTSYVDGRLSYFDLHYLIGTPEGTEHFVERHELGLFTVEEMKAALEAVELKVTYDPEGPAGRGVFVGVRSP
jgi:ubiquinone/menaquinone biosynthesis C-methylase UbiE